MQEPTQRRKKLIDHLILIQLNVNRWFSVNEQGLEVKGVRKVAREVMIHGTK